MLCDLQGTVVNSGDEGARTPDLDSAIVALFQLSYIPVTQAIISYCCYFVKRESQVLGRFFKVAFIKLGKTFGVPPAMYLPPARSSSAVLARPQRVART